MTLPGIHLESLPVLCAILFVDGATLAATSTVLVLTYGRYHEPWVLATAGAAASALGSAVQLRILRWAVDTDHPWLRRFTPSREKVNAALKNYPSASFLALTVARATPLPDAPLKIVAVVGRYPIRLYTLASFLGTVPYFYVLALIGRQLHLPLWKWIVAGAGIVLVGVAFDRLWRRRRASAPPPP